MKGDHFEAFDGLGVRIRAFSNLLKSSSDLAAGFLPILRESPGAVVIFPEPEWLYPTLQSDVGAISWRMCLQNSPERGSDIPTPALNSGLGAHELMLGNIRHPD